MQTSTTSERDFLQRHGTKAFQLKPGSIVGAARNDLETRRRKAEKIEEAGRPYAFCATHVREAKDTVDLIRLALEDLERGRNSSKTNTRLIYEDGALLRAAYEMARSQASA